MKWCLIWIFEHKVLANVIIPLGKLHGGVFSLIPEVSCKMPAILLNICLKTIYFKKRSLRPLRNKSPLQLLRVFQMCYWGLCSYIIHSLNSNRFDQNMAKKTIFPLLLKVFGEWYKYILNSSCISIWLLYQHNLFNCKNAEIHITRQINKFLIKRGLFNVIWATQTSMRHTYIWLLK